MVLSSQPRIYKTLFPGNILFSVYILFSDRFGLPLVVVVNPLPGPLLVRGRVRRGSISSELLMCGGGILMDRYIETIDVCIWRMFDCMSVVVTVGMFVVYRAWNVCL